MSDLLAKSNRWITLQEGRVTIRSNLYPRNLTANEHRQAMREIRDDREKLEQLAGFLNTSPALPPGCALVSKPVAKRTRLNRFLSIFGWPAQYEVTYEFEVTPNV